MSISDRGGSRGDLGLVEILANVLNRVNSPAALAACARVNRLWFEEAIPMLWRGSIDSTAFDKAWRTPTIEKLCSLAVESPRRLRAYLGHVRHLYLKEASVDENLNHYHRRHGQDQGATPYAPLWQVFQVQLQ